MVQANLIRDDLPVRIDPTQAQRFGVELRRDVPLAPLTTMKVGGPADFFATVTAVAQLRDLVQWAHEVALPYFVLGGGSNILISDRGVRGLVIHNRCRAVSVEQERADGAAVLLAESGSAMAGTARQSIRAGLSGLEWAVSVPGTVGGAVVGNAGAHGGEVKDNLLDLRLIDGSGRERMSLDEMAYGYRDSTLKRMKPLQAAFMPVVLSARFALQRGDTAVIKSRADRFLAHRRSTQPVEPSLGSTFVNPPGDFAGRLIEAAGLKGSAVGGAMVSEQHANFVVNPGGVGAASAAAVMALIERIQEAVQREFGVLLEREVQLVGDWE